MSRGPLDALAAPLVHVQRSDALWLIPAVPVLGALVRRLVRRENGSDHMAASLGPTALALLVALSQVYALVSLDPDSRHLIAPGPSPLRIGAMDLGLGLAFDPLAALIASAVALLALAAQGYRVWSEEKAHSAIDIGAGGALLAVLGDSAFGFLVGAAIASSAIAYAAARPAIVERVGDAALVLGAALLFWTLGGSWGISIGYEPTYTRRNPVPDVAQLDALEVDDETIGPAFAPVLIGVPASSATPQKTMTPDLNAKGYITIASPPGVRVFLKGGMEPTGTTPLIHHEVYAGRLDVEIERVGDDGRTVHRQRFRAVDVPPGREVALVTLGPTLAFRPMREQLLLTDKTRRFFARELLDPSVPGHRRLGGFDASTLAALLIGLAALAPIAGAAGAAFGGSALIAEAIVPLLAVYLLARFGYLFTLTTTAAAMVAIAFSALAALAALRATVDHRSPNVLARVLAAHAAIAATAAVLGAPALGAMHGVAAAFSCAVAWALFETLGVRSFRRVSGLGDSAPSMTRASRIAAFAVVGPFVGAGFTRESILARAFASEIPYARVAWMFLAVAAIAMAVAVWRMWFATFSGPSGAIDDPPPRFTLAMMLIAVAVAVLPPVLSLSRASAIAVGGERSIIETFVDPAVDPGALLGADRGARFRELGRGADLGALALVVAGVAGARVLMRRRFADDDRPRIPVRELPSVRVPVSLVSRIDALIFGLRGKS